MKEKYISEIYSDRKRESKGGKEIKTERKKGGWGVVLKISPTTERRAVSNTSACFQFLLFLQLFP